MENSESLKLQYQNLSDDQLIDQALRLKDYQPDAQQLMLAEIRNRAGLSDRLEEKQRNLQLAQQTHVETRKAKYPGFVLGVFTGVIVLTLLSLIEVRSVLNFLWVFFWLIISALVFLSVFDETMRPTMWSRFWKMTVLAILFAFLVWILTGKSIRILGGAIGFALFWFFGWMGSRFFSTVASQSSLVVKASRYFSSEKFDIKLFSPKTDEAFNCSACQAEVKPDTTVCPHCGAKFD